MDELPPEILFLILEYATDEIPYNEISVWNTPGQTADGKPGVIERHCRSLVTKMVRCNTLSLGYTYSSVIVCRAHM